MNKQILRSNIEKLHTTPLGIERIKRNLHLDIEDVVSWCKVQIQRSDAYIERTGKNYYVHVDDSILTINAHSYTIITAHKQ